MHLETSYKKNAANIFELFAVKILSLGLNKFLTYQFYLIISTTTKKTPIYQTFSWYLQRLMVINQFKSFKNFSTFTFSS